ncbi:MAG: hypothetical protein DHS20C19_12650 [Acidimicrobiales bacterium]|nr:MAG: hypothetical protein DHS20C19_12650 [Acidimicrobiales bacterium]
MKIPEYIECVAAEGDRFAGAADRVELDTTIAACDGWDMRALIRHLGLIHLWAAAHVAFSTDDWLDADDIPDMAQYWPELGASWPDDEKLVEWYRRTNGNLVRVLQSAPDDHQCFSFLPAPTPVTMWARRQASEIAIHRFDAEQAGGLPTHFEAPFAVDMLDELLSGFAQRPRSTSIAAATAQVLGVRASDVDEHWHLTIDGDRIRTSRERGDADLMVTATAAELYLLMWNRADESIATLEGDPSVLGLWRESCRVRWSGGE